MPTRELPARPDLEHLKKQARNLLREAHASAPEALQRFQSQNITGTPKLADALHVIAREYGSDSWPALKLKVEMASGDPVDAFAAALKANDNTVVSKLLRDHPELRNRINEPLPKLSFESQAILEAAHKENREMIETLLAAGADINARSHWWAGGFGVLDSASPEFAEYLITRGATVDAHAAARLNKPE